LHRAIRDLQTTRGALKAALFLGNRNPDSGLAGGMADIPQARTQIQREPHCLLELLVP
jgi:hypothetical protein